MAFAKKPTFFKVEAQHGNATVNEYYKVKYTVDESEILHYLITSTGNGGYQDGTVTCRVAIAITNGKPTTIYNATIIGNVGQSYINDIKHMGNYSGKDITGDGFAGYTHGVGYNLSQSRNKNIA